MTDSVNSQLIRCPSCGATNRVRPSSTQNLEPVCGRCKSPLPSATAPLVITDASFHREVEQSTLPVLLDMWAPWCGPCRMIAPVIEQLASELAGTVRVAKLNTDENPQIGARFNVRSIPTLLIFKNGREVERLVGAYPKQEILRKLQSVIG